MCFFFFFMGALNTEDQFLQFILRQLLPAALSPLSPFSIVEI